MGQDSAQIQTAISRQSQWKVSANQVGVYAPSTGRDNAVSTAKASWGTIQPILRKADSHGQLQVTLTVKDPIKDNWS